MGPLTQQLLLSRQYERRGLELGFRQTVVGALKNGLKKSPGAVKSFFNKATSAGRKALKVARRGGQAIMSPGKLVPKTGYASKFRPNGAPQTKFNRRKIGLGAKLAVGAGAVAGISALPNRKYSNPLMQAEPEAPRKITRYKVL